MPFSSGVASASVNFATDAATPPIPIADLDSCLADICDMLSNCILRDGTGSPTAAIDFNSQALTGVARVIVTGATIPTNGIYLSGANTLGLASNTLLRVSINGTGNVVVAAPSAGIAVKVTTLAGGTQPGISVDTGSATDASFIQVARTGTVDGYFGTAGAADDIIIGSAQGQLCIRARNAFRLSTGGTTSRVFIGTAGNITLAAATSGSTLNLASATAIPAGGDLSVGYCMSATNGFGVFAGSGVPTISAAKGSLYLRSDGSSSSTRAYIASDSAGTWVAVTTAS